MVDFVNLLLYPADSMACLFALDRHPAGLLCFVGEGVTWPEIRTIWLWAMVAYKLGFGMLLFVVIWLTLWAKQLAKNRIANCYEAAVFSKHCFLL